MSELRFVPLGTRLVPVPGALAKSGAPPRRICAAVKNDAWVMRADPHTVSAVSGEAQALIRMVQRGDLEAYDQATAEACGVAFRPLEFAGADKGWLPVSSTPKARAAKAGE